MLDEYNALISNGTWVLVPRPANRIIASLHSEFAMTDLGSLNYFLVISAQRSASGLFLSQSKDAEEILERAHIHNCNSCRTLVDTESKLSSDGDPISDPTLYRSLAGALQYLTFTRPYLSYALHVSSTTQLSAYTDADWADCPVTRRSTFGYCVFLGDNLLSWSAKRQVTLSHSSAEGEYRGVANVVAETAWISNLLYELHTLFIATLVYCDNVSVVYMSANPVQHQCTKHIEIDIHVVRDFVASGQVRVLHVPSRFQCVAAAAVFGLPPRATQNNTSLRTNLINCATTTSTLNSTAITAADSSKSLDFSSHHTAAADDGVTVKTYPPCDIKYSEYTPCTDQKRSLKFPRDRLIYRERHCPEKNELLKCRVPAPYGYKNPFKWPTSRDLAWYANVPHKDLTVEKAVQNWIRFEGDRFRFPGGGTMFPNGADAYIDDIGKLINLNDGSIRTAIDTGCGNWIRFEGDRFRFPGGGTMFPNGADAYIDDIGKLINLNDGSIRTAIDTGCG
nr:probable methyltransferase PMT15 [Tanacetum cinerariifolium]